MTAQRPVRRNRPPSDPYGIGPVGGLAAPLLALAGLLVVGWLTLGLMTGDLVVPGGGGGDDGGNGPVNRTPAPSNVVIVDPRADVPGSLVYAKGGNVWIQTGTTARQLTTAGGASMPSWSPDGNWIYYIETVEEDGLFPANGAARRYTLTVPSLMRMKADGSGNPERLASGRFRSGRYTWFIWLRQPVLSPNGRTVALVSDGPDPTKSNVVVQLFDLKTKKFSRPALPETAPLGHQDPTWRPDGKILLYVKDGRDGARGTPAIYRYDLATKRTAAMTGPGYLSPAWSRDGRYVVATRTDSFGTDIVILDARRGTELLRLTNDDRSWSPVWSPRGDAVAFLHLEGGIIDLRMVRLEGAAGAWTAGESIDVTQASQLDGGSRPGWFVPAADLPPLPTTAPSAAASPAAGSSVP